MSSPASIVAVKTGELNQMVSGFSTKDLVNLHHGTIMVESVQGQGTCFTVKLPIDKESYAADELVDETMVSSSAPDEQYPKIVPFCPMTRTGSHCCLLTIIPNCSL